MIKALIEMCDVPDNKETGHLESGRATAPPSVCYSSTLPSASEEYTPATSTHQQQTAEIPQSPDYSTFNINTSANQRTQLTCGYNSDCSPCPDSPSYLSFTKTNTTHHPFQSPSHSEDYFSDFQIQSATFVNNSSSFPNSNNGNSIDVNNSTSNTDFKFTTASKISAKGQEDFNIEEDTLSFHSSEQLSSAAFDHSKIPKSASFPSSKPVHDASNISFPGSQVKGSPNWETVNPCSERNSKSKRNSEGVNKFSETVKDDGFEELLRNGTKIKNAEDDGQELVTDSILQVLHKKNGQETLSYELGDLSPILVSLTSKYKSEEVSGLKKREKKEDLKLMNDFLAKLILEKEEKRFKTLDEKKKFLGKEAFEELSNELNERRVKRDAMSHYQEDKNHKRASNYGDFNQWEYFGQQDIQSSNRRGHFSFGSASQQHSVGWNQMGIGLPRQINPYYSNPHSHMMPAHAHSDYRYNQWNNPNHKNLPNAHNAHSQNTALPQTKMDMKHHSDISSSVQDFGLPLGSTSDFSKFRAASRDLLRRTPPSISDKSLRAGIRSDLLTSMSPGIRNSSLRTPPIASHPKAVINNPLSDLQMLVTNQESETPPEKSDDFQQESVDLSAHSDISKQKGKPEEEALTVNNKKVKDFRTSISVFQIQNKHIKSELNESEKPVELTAKSSEKSCEVESLPPPRGRNSESKKLMSGCSVKIEKESAQAKSESKTSEAIIKTSGLLVKGGEEPSSVTKNEADIPKNLENKEVKPEGKENSVEKKEEAENLTKVEAKPEESSQKSDVVPNSDGKPEEPEKPKEVSETSPENSEKSDGSEANRVEGGAESTKQCKRKAEDDQPSGEKKKPFLEVESQAEKTSGNVEEDNADLPTVSSTSADTKPAVSEIPKKTPKKKPSKKSRMSRLSSGQSSGSERSLPCKKSKGSGSREEGKKKVKKSLCDVMDRRGPFLHVMGSRECPESVTVVNFPKGDDEDEKDKSSTKKQILNASRPKHQNELDYRGRSRNGLYSSTLSARYDAHSKDYTWICVFCKKGPHFNSLGDLFGPYIISEDENTCLGEFSGDEKDISDAQKRGGRNKKSLRSNNMVEHFQKMSKKLRRTQSTESCLTGMTVISDDQVDQLRYEVWVHEQCAVWSPNVFLIGSRIIGMQEAIWCSVKTMCSKCGITGANIGCVYRNCPNRSHYHCAKECGWSLEQETFISTCHIHKPRS